MACNKLVVLQLSVPPKSPTTDAYRREHTTRWAQDLSAGSVDLTSPPQLFNLPDATHRYTTLPSVYGSHACPCLHRRLCQANPFKIWVNKYLPDLLDDKWIGSRCPMMLCDCTQRSPRECVDDGDRMDSLDGALVLSARQRISREGSEHVPSSTHMAGLYTSSHAPRSSTHMGMAPGVGLAFADWRTRTGKFAGKSLPRGRRRTCRRVLAPAVRAAVILGKFWQFGLALHACRFRSLSSSAREEFDKFHFGRYIFLRNLQAAACIFCGSLHGCSLPSTTTWVCMRACIITNADDASI